MACTHEIKEVPLSDLFSPTEAQPQVEERLHHLADMLSRIRFRFTDEDSLQRGIAEALQRKGYLFRREESLSARDRPDFLLDGGLAIEVKVGGSLSDLLRQVARYTEHKEVRGILVMGSPVWLPRVPATLGGKPVFHLRIIGSLL